MRLVLLSLYLVSLGFCFTLDRETFCYAENAEPNLSFGTKTSYECVANTNTDEITLPGCNPVQVWMFNRHGTRWPRNEREPESGVLETELEQMHKHLPLLRDQIVLNHAIGRGFLCDEDVENLKNWTLNVDITNPGGLAPAGEEEMRGIGQRFKARLPGLMNKTYTNEHFAFRFTTSSRAENSCRNFAKGVWGDGEKRITYPTAIEGDPITRFYKLCNRYNIEVDSFSSSSRIEIRKFIEGPEVARVVQKVSQRLGFVQQLPYDLIILAYTMCRYDKALHFKRISPWCATFSGEDISVLEYIDDLIYYYKEAYGYDINWMQACSPVVDVFNYFNSMVSGAAKKPYGIFNFSHSRAMGKLLARLGMYKDTTPPTATNFAFNSERQWKTSRILPFGLNIVFVLFECEMDIYKVQLYVNEKLEKISGCANTTCIYSEFVDYVEPIVNNCDLNAICENNSALYSYS